MIPTFITDYLDYTKGGECPQFLHAWSCLSGVATMLGRRVYYPFGTSKIYPNMYVMIVGEPASKKSTAIKLCKSVMSEAGYTEFAASNTSMQKFLMDLAKVSDNEVTNGADIILQNLNLQNIKEPAESYIAIDEMRSFMGENNTQFATLLTDFWDRDTDYDYKIKTGRSFVITLPTINLLGGSTAGSFHAMFPSSLAEQGFLSRLILVHAEASGRKVTFPPIPAIEKRNIVVNNFCALASLSGTATLSTEATSLIDKIYQADGDKVRDGRFKTYETRRLAQLFKLCMVTAAMKNTLHITEEHVLFANTILTYTERLMPKVLGEYGKAKYAEVAQRIVDLVNKSHMPVPALTILREVAKDLDNGVSDLNSILNSLREQGKIQAVSGTGYLGVKQILLSTEDKYIDLSIIKQLGFI